MRTQGEARFTGQWQAKVGAASMVQDAIAKEQEAKPKYSLTVSLVVGSVILVCMGAGVYLAVIWRNYGL